jgi:hypothetical protein
MEQVSSSILTTHFPTSNKGKSCQFSKTETTFSICWKNTRPLSWLEKPVAAKAHKFHRYDYNTLSSFIWTFIYTTFLSNCSIYLKLAGVMMEKWLESQSLEELLQPL